METIPQFQGTEEAESFGKSHQDDPDTITHLKSEYQTLVKVGEILSHLIETQGNPTKQSRQKRADYTFRAQLVRESFEAAERKGGKQNAR